MKSICGFLHILVLSVTLLAAAMPSPQANSLEALKRVVVKLTVRSTNGGETAAGVFVGQDSQKAYFLTACHAIIDRCKEKPGDPIQSIRLQFYNAPTLIESSIFENFDPVTDLGVVTIPIRSLAAGIPRIVIRDAEAGVAVRIIGHPSAGGWGVWTGNVQNENGTDVLRFTTTRNASLADGYSGGGVFDPQGAFLGMHSATYDKYGVEIKGADILKRLKSWNVPTGNFTAARNEPPTSTPTPGPEGVNRILTRYADAYNRRDANALWTIWPDADAQKRQSLGSSFKNARSISMTLINMTIEITGSRAVATGQFSQDYVPVKGAVPPAAKNQPISIELESRNGNWVITSVK